MVRRMMTALAACGLALTAGRAASAEDLTDAQAKALVAPLYDALNAPATKDVAALLDRVGGPDWMSCSGTDACVPRDVGIQNITGFGKMVPDAAWRVLSVTASGNEVTVRSEASGTPVGTFFGVPATGHSFRIMAIDIHQVADGKIVRSYHVEDWAGAIRQVTGK